MSAQSLGNKGIIGSFYKTLKAAEGSGWINAVSMMFRSDQEVETYKWLGQVPAMREWIGGRQAKGFSDNGLTIKNRHYEGTIEVMVDELRRDKTGQVMVRINELARRTVSHWNTLLSTLIINGESTVCYDGQYFFDTDHNEGSSGVQSNDLSLIAGTFPTPFFGSLSVEQFQFAMIKGIQQILGFVDDRGEPMNEDATSFLVMVPLVYWHLAQAAIKNSSMAGVPSMLSLDVLDGINIQFAANVRLDKAGGWTNKFVVWRTDSETKGLIRQEETPIKIEVIGEGSELAFKEKKHEYGVDAWRNVGYGFWQDACLVTVVV